MKKRSIIGVLLAMLFSTALVTAQDQETGADSDTPDATVPSSNERETIEDDVFIPTEEVQAAEELTFPVDI